MKVNILKRIELVADMAKTRSAVNLQKLVSKMTTEELRECLGDGITEDRLKEIAERAEQR